MGRLVALVLGRPFFESKQAALAFALVAGLLAGLAWAALTRRAGLTRRERFASVLVPAVAVRALLATYAVWPGEVAFREEPLRAHALWQFSALGALAVTCGALAGVALAGLRASPAEEQPATARDYAWLLVGLLLGCACENFALYERFLHSFGELRCREASVILAPRECGTLPRVPSPALGSYQLELVRQALAPSPPNPFVKPTGLVQLTDPETRVLQVLGAAFELVLALAVLLGATHLKGARPAWRRWLAGALGTTCALALGFAAVVVARSRAAGLAAPTTALLPTSDFRELVFVAAASVTGLGCLGAFLFAPWGKGARLACAFAVVSALTVLRRVLDDAVAPDFRYVEFDIDIHGARFGVEMALLGACALLLALGVFPWRARRTLVTAGGASFGRACVMTAALLVFVRSLTFARDARIHFTSSGWVDPRIARVKSCREPYAWGAPLWFREDVTPAGDPVPSVEQDHEAYRLLHDKFTDQLRRREAERPLAHARDRDRVVGVAADLDAPVQDVRCVLVAAASANASVVVLAQEVEELATTIGPVSHVIGRCGAGGIKLTEDERASPLNPHWTMRELLEQAREHRFNPRLDPASLPPGCR